MHYIIIIITRVLLVGYWLAVCKHGKRGLNKINVQVEKDGGGGCSELYLDAVALIS